MTPADYLAFTVAGDGLLREITAPVKVGFAVELAKLFGLSSVPVDFTSLWDTGATNTSVSKRLVAQLKLIPIDKKPVCCAGKTYDSGVYKIDLFLPNMVRINNVNVTEFEDNGRFDVLVGMDVIVQGDFSITNCNKKTLCSFRMPPDIEHIDYVATKKHRAIAKEAAKKFKKKQRKH